MCESYISTVTILWSKNVTDMIDIYLQNWAKYLVTLLFKMRLWGKLLQQQTYLALTGQETTVSSTTTWRRLRSNSSSLHKFLTAFRSLRSNPSRSPLPLQVSAFSIRMTSLANFFRPVIKHVLRQGSPLQVPYHWPNYNLNDHRLCGKTYPRQI